MAITQPTATSIGAFSSEIATEKATRGDFDVRIADAVIVLASEAASEVTSLTARASTGDSAATSLTTRVSTEESTRASQATSLTTRVSTEESTRASAVTSINVRLSTLYSYASL